MEQGIFYAHAYCRKNGGRHPFATIAIKNMEVGPAGLARDPNDTLTVGVSIVSSNDNFSRAMGRKRALERIEERETSDAPAVKLANVLSPDRAVNLLALMRNFFQKALFDEEQARFVFARVVASFGIADVDAWSVRPVWPR